MRNKTSFHSGMIYFLLLGILGYPLMSTSAQAVSGKIDRKALVTRHNLLIKDRNLYGPTQVGNGEFAFGFDITGLQTFSNSANTMSNWGWHQFPTPNGQRPEDFKGQEWDTQGRMVRYDVQNPEQQDLRNWMVQNPQRIHLGRVGLVLKKKSGSLASLNDLQNPEQVLDLWSGISTSTFSISSEPVTVTTIGHPSKDGIAVRIKSRKVAEGSIGIFLDFPYASLHEFGNGADWGKADQHQTVETVNGRQVRFQRIMNATRYDVRMSWDQNADFKKVKAHRYEVMPVTDADEICFIVCFDKEKDSSPLPTFAQTEQASVKHWADFWQSGGAIDLSESKDPRWKELERRIVLSQYIMAVNEAGSLPPQESGLVNNGWYGKYHHEMIWWHCTHYALWDRWSLMNKMMEVYPDNLETYKKSAKAQGYKGVRWPKTIGDRTWWEWPNETNPLLIWQQPHAIFFAELDYRSHPTQETLNKWKNIVFETADFMASYAYYNKKEKRYILGYPLQVVSENCDPRTTYNPTFELSYWLTGLRIAQDWAKRLKVKANPEYEKVRTKLSALPVKDGVYVSWENITDMWTKYNFEHPALIGAYGMLPGDGVDIPTMQRTLDKVEQVWQFHETWGWDFPMLAMTAARLGKPEKALDYLLSYATEFAFEDHGFVGGGRAPFPYFPGNGGLLYAVAMMAAGWDGAPDVHAPGFPQDGSWIVKWEGLKKAL